MLILLIYWIKAYVLTTKKHTEALLVNRKEIVLEVNGETTKCMFMFREHYSGQNHSIKIDHKSFESVENFKYFGTSRQIKLIFVKKLRTG
jgi:hypothetical protein